MDNAFPVKEYNLIKIAANFRGFASPGGDPRSNASMPCWYILNGAGVYNVFDVTMTKNFGIITFDGSVWTLFEADILETFIAQLIGLDAFQVGGFAIPSTNPLPFYGNKIWFASQDGEYNYFQDDLGFPFSLSNELVMFFSTGTKFTKQTILNLASVRSARNFIYNSHEPYSSMDAPDPFDANYFKGDDYVYERCGEIWKRSILQQF